MNIRKITALCALCALSASIFCSGCSLTEDVLPGKGADTLSVSAPEETPEKVITGGELTIHSRFYAADKAILTGATVSFYQDNELIFSGVTDEAGQIGEFTFPSDKDITIQVADAAGSKIGESVLFCKISSEYEDMIIIPVDKEAENGKLEINIPYSKQNVSAAFYATSDGRVGISNIESYVDGTIEAPAEEEITVGTPADPVEGEVTDDTSAPAE